MWHPYGSAEMGGKRVGKTNKGGLQGHNETEGRSRKGKVLTVYTIYDSTVYIGHSTFEVPNKGFEWYF